MFTASNRSHRSHLFIASGLISRSFVFSLLLALGLACLNAMPAAARDLPIVKPVMDCGALVRMVLSNPEFQGRVESAVQTATEPPMPAFIKGMITEVKTPHPFCDVKGYLTPQVHFELHLPTENWTQRLLFEGCGGFCGTIMLFGVFGGNNCLPATNGEFAVVSSDLGHSSVALTNMDAVWAADKDLRRDFGYRGVHVTTLAAKQIVERFYGQPQAYAYFDGCSDGGREAMVAVERYPADFNGVIAGAPVVNEVANNTVYHAWGVQHLLHSDGSKVFSDAALATLHQAALAACGETTDPNTGVIADPTQCHFDPASAACKGGEAVDTCLTPEQVKEARNLYIGAQDPEGHPLYYGYDIGSEMNWNRETAGDAKWGFGSFPGYLASDPPNPNLQMSNLPFTQEAVKKMYVFADDLNALNPDLRPFQKAGGKLIMWHGWGDVAVASQSSPAFYRAVRAKAGAGIDDFMRLYMLPGVAHCGGGEGPDKMDLVATILAWTEDGVAPGPMTATKKDATGAVTATRVIQPYK